MKIAAVIPCYNEAERLPEEKFVRFLSENNSCALVFANDGSTDKTAEVLENIRTLFPGCVHVINFEKNLGKAEAVRLASLEIIGKNPDLEKIGYLDADFSASAEEWLKVSKKIKNSVVFAYGSRILKIDTEIRRKAFRHFTGRAVATFISKILRLKVYDTQCGCKAMRADVAAKVFEKPFISRWLFDVEIFFRISMIFGRENMKDICREIPLKRWEDTADSRVKISYFFRMWQDLFLIDKKYNRG